MKVTPLMLQAHLLLLKVIYNTIEETICFFFFFKLPLRPLFPLWNISSFYVMGKKMGRKKLKFNLQILSMFRCEKGITSHFEQ